MRATSGLVASAIALLYGCTSEGNQTSTPDSAGQTSLESNASSSIADSSDSNRNPHTTLGHGHCGKHGKRDCNGSDGGVTPPTEPACGWAPLGHGLGGANISAVLYDERVHSTALATSGPTVWTNNGSGWNAGGDLTAGSFTDLALDFGEVDAYLAASNSGVHRSADGGKTWTQISLDGLTVTALATTSAAPLQVYAASDGAGVYRSHDGGRTWLDVGYGYPFGSTPVISVDPDDPDSLVSVVRYMGQSGGYLDDGAVMESTDGGQTWATILDGQGFISAIERCPGDPSVMVAGTRNGLASSNNGGVDWSFRALDGALGWVYGVEFGPGGCDDYYALQVNAGPRHTGDGGATLGPPETNGLNVQPVGSFPGKMAVSHSAAGSALLGTHGGLYERHAATAAWQLVSEVSRMAITGLAASPATPGVLWLSSWGTGVWSLDPRDGAWNRAPSARLPEDYASSVAVAPWEPRGVFAATPNSLYQSIDGSTFSARPVAGNPTAIAFAPSTKAILVATQLSGLIRSDDQGASWSSSNGDLQPWPTPAGSFIDVRGVAFDSVDELTVYAATNGRGLLRSVDGGHAWEPVLEPQQQVRCVNASARSGGLVRACVRGVQESDSSGATWTDISSGLPTLDINALVEDPNNGDLYATTASGVYKRPTDGEWALVDGHCLGGAGPATLLPKAGGLYLVVAGGGGVVARRLQ